MATHRVDRSLRLSRNPSWDAATDERPAYLDEIAIDATRFDASKAAMDVASGSHLAFAGSIPIPVLGLVPALFVQRVPAGGTRFIVLNTRSRALRRADVRRGIAAGMDRAALRRARGGANAGPIATHLIPPGIPGFDEAGGAAGTGADFLAAPRGDPALPAWSPGACGGWASGSACG